MDVSWRISGELYSQAAVASGLKVAARAADFCGRLDGDARGARPGGGTFASGDARGWDCGSGEKPHHFPDVLRESSDAGLARVDAAAADPRAGTRSRSGAQKGKNRRTAK